jgi:hypothetical protein
MDQTTPRHIQAAHEIAGSLRDRVKTAKAGVGRNMEIDYFAALFFFFSKNGGFLVDVRGTTTASPVLPASANGN